MTKITNEQIKTLAQSNDIEYAMLKSFIETESGGKGFDPSTGKIIIQFEPSWYRKKAPYAPSGLWSLNKVETQSKEWPAFNNAFKLNPNAAMEATSWGLPQIMGFHYARLGFKTIGAFVDYMKKGEFEQVEMLVKFIVTDKKLYQAIKDKNFSRIASIYNGKFFKEMAIQWKREPYDITLKKGFIKYSS